MTFAHSAAKPGVQTFGAAILSAASSAGRHPCDADPGDVIGRLGASRARCRRRFESWIERAGSGDIDRARYHRRSCEIVVTRPSGRRETHPLDDREDLNQEVGCRLR